MTQTSIAVISAIPPELREVLSRDNALVEVKRTDGPRPDFTIAVTTSVGGADRATFEQFPALKLLLCNGTGVENIDLDEAARRGVVVRNTPDEVTDDTADFAIGLMYAVSRRLAEADRFVRSGRWETERMTPSRRLFDRNLGIVGLGKIGQTIARRAGAIGMTVRYTGPRAKAGVPYDYVGDIKRLAELSDFLVLSCPGGQETHRIVGTSVLQALGPEGVLVNVSRGTVVDEDALVAALEAKTIAGAGLDVFDNEPKIDPRLRGFDRVVLAPHYAAVTRETRYDIANALATAVKDLAAGRPIRNAAGERS